MTAKFELGQKVKYLPKLTGFDNRKKLEIVDRYFKESDSLHDALGIPFQPTWVYFFKGTLLSAIEKDII